MFFRHLSAMPERDIVFIFIEVKMKNASGEKPLKRKK
jgi:hypothetical protein